MVAIGCAPTDPHASSFSSGADIRDALSKAGLTCTGYKPTAGADREWGEESAADVGGCVLQNENITMDIWKDTGQKDNFVGMGQKTGCAIGKDVRHFFL